ncbi:hypothetical protein IFM89_032201 [Coptis chinensis]|uniref:ribonuclease Z n=1 Tax=Coptis chinensis TaxID=261450 RepID=A0A835HU92_9MAGN|nr:hypothetical protein IFM89_032201 [Coptis chinensis]
MQIFTELLFQLLLYRQLGLNRSGILNSLTQKEIVNELISEIPEIVDSVAQVQNLWNESTDTEREPKQEDVVTVEEPLIDGNSSLPKTNLRVQNKRNSSEGTLGLKCSNTSEGKFECPLPSSLENISREDMEIVFLGTGSSQPSQYRNVSSILVNLFSKGGLLLDCGEGTLGQLKRRYGASADDVVRSLVSGFLIFMLIITQLKDILDCYQRLEDLDMQFLDCHLTALENSLELRSDTVNTNTHLQSLKNLKKVLEEASLEVLVSIPVLHCPQAFGLVVKAAERSNTTGKIIPGWKLVYSGDTRPCSELIEAARGATATFEDGMVKDAIKKKHNTTKEAIEVGDSADAYRIILTHFSKRYPKIPVFDETYMHKTCIAFDFMSINIADLPVLPKVLPFLKFLFRKEIIAYESDDTECS